MKLIHKNSAKKRMIDYLIKEDKKRNMKNIEYTNAQEMARKYPDTFYAPSKSDLKKIKKGDSVKVCVNDLERFWVSVTKVKGENVSGLVDNDLVLKSHGLKYKDLIVFEKKNIYDIA